MQLSSWAKDRGVESIIYGRLNNKPSASPEQSRQIAFNTLCERAASLVLRDFNAGIAIVDAVDAVFDDEEWKQYLLDMDRWSKPDDDPHRDEMLADRFPWAVARGISPPTKQTAKRCLRVLNAVSAAHDNLRKADHRFQVSTPEDTQDQDHLWFLADPVVPPDLRRGMLAHRRGAVALIATYPITTPVIMQKHFGFVLKMLEFTTEMMNEYLGVVANIPEARVSIVAADGSNMARPTLDVAAPFRAALRRAGESDVHDPA